jgi:hypothetical protein
MKDLRDILILAILAAFAWFGLIEPRMDPQPVVAPAPVVIYVEPMPTAAYIPPPVNVMPQPVYPTQPGQAIDPNAWMSAITPEAGIVVPGLNPAAITADAGMMTNPSGLTNITPAAGTNP